MHFGRIWGNYWGDDEAAGIYAAIDPDDPSARTLSWSAGPSGCVYVVMLDATEHWRGTATELSGIPPDVRENIEVWECSPQNRAEDLTLFATSALEHVALAWAEATGTPARYELYRSLTSGSYTDPPVFECMAGQTSYSYRDGPLADDTYYYRLTAYDAAGNAVNAAEQDVTVNRSPAPPTDVQVSHNDGTGLTTISWTAPADADLDHYAIRYGDPLELTGSPDDTDSASPWTQDNSGVTAHREFLVQSVDAAGNASGALSSMAAIDLDAGVQVSRPNSPTVLGQAAIAAGEAQVMASYDRTGASASAATLELYANDGAGGAVDYNTAVGSIAVPAGGPHALAVESSGLTGGLTYVLAVRARTSGGVEDLNTDTVSVLTDSTAPGAPTFTATAS